MLNILANLFCSKNPQREAKNQLRETQLELLEANAAKEHWEARVVALKNRERRLQTQVQSDEREAERLEMARSM